MMEAIYARQSLDIKDSISIETQVDSALTRCAGGPENVKIYIDKGFSGKNISRPGFTDLFVDIRAGYINKVVVYRMDRFSRSILDFADIWETMEEYKVEFLSINENFDTSTSMGRAMLFIIIIFAQYERELISERIRDNYYQRVQKGYWPGGPAPYGYSIGKFLLNMKHIPTLIVNKTEADIVTKLYLNYLKQDVTLVQLAGQLNAAGMMGPNSNPWNSLMLSRILGNPVYAICDKEIYFYFKKMGICVINEEDRFDGKFGGMLVGKNGKTFQQCRVEPGIDVKFSLGHWPGVITSEVWLPVQKKLQKNTQFGKQRYGEHSWLTGIFKCGYCRKSLSICFSNNYYYAYCSRKKSNECKEGVRFPLSEIEFTVEQEIDKILNRVVTNTVQSYTAEANNNQIELAKLQSEIENCEKILHSGQAAVITVKYIKKELEKLKQFEFSLLKLLEDEKDNALTFLTKIDFSNLEFTEKKVIAKRFLKYVYVYHDMIEIEWKI